MSSYNRDDEAIRTVEGAADQPGSAPRPRKKKNGAKPGRTDKAARDEDDDDALFGDPDDEDAAADDDDDDDDKDDKDADDADADDADLRRSDDDADDPFLDDDDEDADDDDEDSDEDEVAAPAGLGAVRPVAEEPPEISRKVRRRRKRSRPRSKTIAMKRLTREELRLGALLYPPVDIPRPSNRSECGQDMRPCPWVACKHHLYLDVNPETGSIKINFPDLEPWELTETCALDVAERGGITLEEVGEIMNLTRERIRQVEVRGLLKLKMASPSPDELGAALLRGEAVGEEN